MERQGHSAVIDKIGSLVRESDQIIDLRRAFHADNNQPIEQTNPSEAEANEPDPVVRTDPLLSKRVSDDAPEPHDQPSPAAPVVRAVEPEPSVSQSHASQTAEITPLFSRYPNPRGVLRFDTLQERNSQRQLSAQKPKSHAAGVILRRGTEVPSDKEGRVSAFHLRQCI